ncbi:MAG: hypothetical protein AB7T06_30605 [Kofleriaceae bacterium]
MKIAIAMCLVAVLGGCDGKKKNNVSGVGKYKFTTTTLADAKEGNCQPTQLDDGRMATWCFALPPFKLGKQTVADVDLYFDGQTPEAKLIEIQLKIRGCQESEVESWMRSAFGPPIESKATRVYWKNDFLWAAALLPSEPARCLIHLLPLSENAEIERIKQK